MNSASEDHKRGWIDATMRLKPPLFESDSYIRGYREGTRQRLFDAEQQIYRLKFEPTKEA